MLTFRTAFLPVVMVATAGAFGQCGLDDDSSNTTPEGLGQLKLYALVAPSEESPTKLSGGMVETLAGFERLEIQISRIDVVLATGSEPVVRTVRAGPAEITLAERRVESAPRFLLALDVPAARVEQIRLIVESASIRLRGEDHPVKIPGGTQAGIKIDAPAGAPFDVRAGEPVSVAAALDLFSQLIRNRGEGFLLKPQLDGQSFFDVAGAPSAIVPDELVVRFAPDVGRQAIDAILEQYGLTILRTVEPLRLYAVQIPDGADEEELLIELATLPEISDISPETLVENLSFEHCFDPAYPRNTRGAFDCPAADPLFATNQPQWPAIRLDTDFNGHRLGWNACIGLRQVVVAVVETGPINIMHPDLIENAFINPGEVPDVILARVGDRNGNGVLGPLDLDFNGDGAISFGDLDDLIVETGDQVICEDRALGIPGRCDPWDLVTGEQAFGATVPTEGCVPRSGSEIHSIRGWEDGEDDDCNGLVDDIVGWNFGANNVDLQAAYQHYAIGAR